MFSKIYSFGVLGIDGYVVTVETHISGGMPGFEIVGLPDNAVKEAKERVRSAIKNNGFSFKSLHFLKGFSPVSAVNIFEIFIAIFCYSV